MTLFIAFAVVLAGICALGLVRRPRLAAPLVAVTLAAAYWTGADLLGRAKPVRLTFALESADVVGGTYDEGVAIWLMVREGDEPPRLYSFPWSREMAEQMTAAAQQAGEEGAAVRLMLAPDGEPLIYPEPQPPMPAKD